MFLVDMHFTDMSKVTLELTELHKAYLAQEYAKGSWLLVGEKYREPVVLLFLTIRIMKNW